MYNQKKFEELERINLGSAVNFIYVSPEELLKIWFILDYLITKKQQFLESGDAY